MVRARALLPLLLLAAELLSGCRPSPEALGTPLRFDALGDRVAPTPDRPRTTTLRLPADFPGDVHLPARYALDTVTDMPGTRVVSLLAEGDVARLSQDTRQAMEQDGWQRRLATPPPTRPVVMPSAAEDATSTTDLRVPGPILEIRRRCSISGRKVSCRERNLRPLHRRRSSDLSPLPAAALLDVFVSAPPLLQLARLLPRASGPPSSVLLLLRLHLLLYPAVAPLCLDPGWLFH